MKHVYVAQAEGIDRPVEPVTIHVTQAIPQFLFPKPPVRGPTKAGVLQAYQRAREAAAAFYRDQARLIVNALWGGLPGATVDQVLVELLLQKASELRVCPRSLS